VVFSAKLKKIEATAKGLMPVFSGTHLLEGRIEDAVNMACNKSDLKVTLEAMQAGFFDEDDQPDGKSAAAGEKAGDVDDDDFD
jgi:hypothetical protein